MSDPLGAFLTGLMGGVEGGANFRNDLQVRRQQTVDREQEIQLRKAANLRAQVGMDLDQRLGAQRIASSRSDQIEAERQRKAVATAAARLRAMPNLDPRLGALPDAQLIDAMGTLATRKPERVFVNEPGQQPGFVSPESGFQPVPSMTPRPVPARPAPRPAPSPTAVEDRQRGAWIANKVHELTSRKASMQYNPTTHRVETVGPLSLEDATRQANAEWAAAHPASGGGGARSLPTLPPLPQ